jgi:hypothetical protein
MASPEMRSRRWVGIHGEVTWVRPQAPCPWAPDGSLAIYTRRLDLHRLLVESDAHDAAPEVETGSQIV